MTHTQSFKVQSYLLLQSLQLGRYVKLFNKVIMFKAELGSNFSRIRKHFQLKTSFCQLSNMASSGLKKMLTFIILYEVFGKILFFTIFYTMMLCVDLFFYNGILYDHCGCRQMLCLLLWQMFLPIFLYNSLWQMISH